MKKDSVGVGRGRPQKFPGEGARVSHSLRLKPAMAEKLRKAALAANRSLGEEMELRINKSFEIEAEIEGLVAARVAQKISNLETARSFTEAQLLVEATRNRYQELHIRNSKLIIVLQLTEERINNLEYTISISNCESDKLEKERNKIQDEMKSYLLELDYVKVQVQEAFLNYKMAVDQLSILRDKVSEMMYNV